MDLKRDARRRAGRRATQDCTLMPAMSLEHEVVRAVLVSAPQLTGRARTLLQAGASTSVLSRHSHPHGCKATVPSRMAKAAAPMEDRRLLGGHAQHGRTATLCVLQRYSSRTAAETQKMVSAEHQGFRETERQPHSFTSHTSDGLPSAG